MEESAGEFDLPHRSNVTVAFESTFAVVFAILSIVGNTLIIAAFCKRKTLRTIPNLLVVNLSIIDILSAITTHPLLASVLIFGGWRLGLEACKYQAVLNSFLFTTSHLSITLITLNRYFVIVHYKKYTEIFTKRSTRILTVAIWIFSFILGSTHFIAQEEVKFHAKEAVCVISKEESSITSFLLTMFGNIVFLTTVSLNFAILKLVRLHRKQVSSSFGRNFFRVKATSRKAQENAAKTHTIKKQGILANRNEEFYIARKVVIVTSLYTFCWLPQGILKNASLASDNFSREIWMTSTFCMQLSSVLNPVLYGFLNRKLKKAIFGMLGIETSRRIHVTTTEKEVTTRRSRLKNTFTVSQAPDQGMITEATLRLE
ncbi:alpha-1D adrenergic receptor-like [Oculina patagonica]